MVHNDSEVLWLGLDGKTLRKAPVGSFTNAEEGTSSNQYEPSPVDANLMLLVVSAMGTPACHKRANDSSYAAYLYDADSGTNYRMTPKKLAVISAAWNPDGKRIYFSAQPDAPPNAPARLYRVNADGSGLMELGPGAAPSVGMRIQ